MSLDSNTTTWIHIFRRLLRPEKQVAPGQRLLHVFTLPLLLSSILLSPVTQASSTDYMLVDRYQKQLRLARAGEPPAMYEVGRMLERGRGTSIDMAEAAKWYQQAIKGGYAPAQARLGIMYVEGRGVKQNTAKALQLLRAAANKTIPSAQYQLATMYELGVGVNINLTKAIHWYKKAAEGGYTQARNKVQELSAMSSAPVPKNTANKLDGVHSNAITLMKGKWSRSGMPAAFLPSSSSNCQLTASNNLKCISTAQERSTGSEIISYSTTSTITNFHSNKFVIRYVNNVLEVETIEDNESDLEENDDEEDDNSQDSTSRVKTGKQEKIHLLQCSLKNKRTVECTRNKTRTYVFDNIAK